MSAQRPSGLEARRQPHQVEIHQLHAFEVVAGGTRSVEFVFEFFGVESSPPGLVFSDITCSGCTLDVSQPPAMIQWQLTSQRKREHGVENMITVTWMLTFKVSADDWSAFFCIFQLSQAKIHGRVLPETFQTSYFLLVLRVKKHGWRVLRSLTIVFSSGGV